MGMAAQERQFGSGKEGKLGVSVLDVASRAGVSTATVSRVLNGHPRVGADLRDRVLRTSRRMGFKPTHHLKSLGLIVGQSRIDARANYIRMMVAMLTEHMAEHGYMPQLVHIEQLERAYEAHVDGVLGVVFDHRIASLREIPGLPILTINEQMTELGTHAVSSDHYQQAVLATRHLLGAGHRRIGFLENSRPGWGGRQRTAGYRSCMESAQRYDPELVMVFNGQSVYSMMTRLMSLGVTAIANFAESATLEIMHILQGALGRSIPEDISMISMEDCYSMQHLSPPLTVIQQPLEELSRVAVEKIIALCQSPEPPNEIVNVTLPCKLLERASVAGPKTHS